MGPMFSGKTVWLNNMITSLADQEFSVLKIVHSDDNRDNNSTGSSHSSSRNQLSLKINCIKTHTLKDIDVTDYRVIGIDECQFFPDLFECVRHWVEDLGKHVYASGLDGDFQKKKFGQLFDLIPICDSVEKIRSVCRVCLDESIEKNGGPTKFVNNALFSKRKTADKNQKLVGGSDLYIPVCREHYTSFKYHPEFPIEGFPETEE